MHIRTLLVSATLVGTAACASSGPPEPPTDVPPCTNAAAMEPVELEIGKAAEDGVTWGPRLAAGSPRGGITQVRVVEFGGSGTPRPSAGSRPTPPMGAVTVRMVVDPTGAVVARDPTRTDGGPEMTDAAMEITGDFRFHPAQRNGCAIPSVVEWTLNANR